MVFGVFDNFHAGHRFFIEQSKKHGQHLIIVVARDKTVRQIKSRSPQWHELKRLEILRQRYSDATIILGDEQQGSYDVIKAHKPDLICVGYDQHALKTDLETKMPDIKIIEIKAHKPEEYKSLRIV